MHDVVYVINNNKSCFFEHLEQNRMKQRLTRAYKKKRTYLHEVKRERERERERKRASRDSLYIYVLTPLHNHGLTPLKYTKNLSSL